ncbi:MAG: hypothetical protein GXP41_11985 [Chloroflexi bacterium]|nr:hypothetical protein [Chloroflexota bacterium]
MTRRNAIVLTLILLCGLVLVGTTFAQTSANFRLIKSVQANAGNPMASASYTLHSTLGQSSAATARSTGYDLRAGYWGAPNREAAPAYRLFLPVICKDASL